MTGVELLYFVILFINIYIKIESYEYYCATGSNTVHPVYSYYIQTECVYYIII